MNTYTSDDLLFVITKDEMQYAAFNRFGRFLTEEEIRTAKKGFEWGLLSDIDVITDTIFDMIQEKSGE